MSKQALQGKRIDVFMMEPTDLTIVGLDTDDGPENPLWDERINLKVSEAMVNNMMLLGVLETVLVTKVNGSPVVIDGRQRVRAAREANKRFAAVGSDKHILVPCMVRKGGELSLVGAGYSANEIRQNNDALTNARNLERFINMGGTEKEAAVYFGVTTQTISNWLKVACASVEEQKAIADGAMSAQDVVKQASKPRVERVQAVKKAQEAKAAGAPPKKRGRPKGGEMSRKRQMALVVKAAEAAGKKKMLVHPEFLRGLQFALEQITAEEAGVAEILAVAIEPKAKAKGGKKGK